MRLWLLLLTFNILSINASAISCHKVISEKNTYLGYEYNIKNGTRTNLPQEIFSDYNKNDVYIGMVNGHAYLVAGGFRYDGGLGIMNHSAKIRSKSYLSSGVIFRLKNLPEESLTHLISMLEQNQKPLSPTCSGGVCNFLSKAGIKKPGLNRLLPSRLILELLTHGLSLEDGSKVKMDISVIDRKSIEQDIIYTRVGEVFVATAPWVFVIGGLSFLSSY